jgi:hypothetical protein
MLLTYPAGVMREHKHAREHAGLFDISQYKAFELSGPDASFCNRALLDREALMGDLFLLNARRMGAVIAAFSRWRMTYHRLTTAALAAVSSQWHRLCHPRRLAMAGGTRGQVELAAAL